MTDEQAIAIVKRNAEQDGATYTGESSGWEEVSSTGGLINRTYRYRYYIYYEEYTVVLWKTTEQQTIIGDPNLGTGTTVRSDSTYTYDIQNGTSNTMGGTGTVDGSSSTNNSSSSSNTGNSSNSGVASNMNIFGDLSVVHNNRGYVSADPSKVLYFVNYARMYLNVASSDDYIPMSLGYLMIYIILIVFTIMFAVRYMKRVIYVAFLTLMAPMVALTYPIDKIKDRKSTSI